MAYKQLLDMRGLSKFSLFVSMLSELRLSYIKTPGSITGRLYTLKHCALQLADI